MPDFTDAELRQIYQNPKADLSLLSQDELGRLDKLTSASRGRSEPPSIKGYYKNLVSDIGGLPESIASAIASPVESTLSLADRIKGYATDPLNTLYDHPLGPALDYAGVRAGIPIVKKISSLAAPMAVTGADLGWAGAKGIAKDTAMAIPPVRGFVRGIKERIDERAASVANRGGRLVPSAEEMQPLTQILNDVRGMDTANDLPDIAGATKPIAKIATKNRVSLEPSVRPDEMVATLPDKWGATSIRPRTMVEPETLRRFADDQVTRYTQRPTSQPILTPNERALLQQLWAQQQLGGR